MKNRFLSLLAFTTFLVVTTSPVFAELTGTWSASTIGGNKMQIRMSQRSPGRTWNENTSRNLSEFRGLESARLQDSAHPVTFQMVREAGTVSFQGTFSEGSGSGRFSFEPSSTYLETMRSLGVRTDSKGNDQLKNVDLFQLAMWDISSATVRELSTLGLRDLSLSDLVTLKIHGASTAYIREMQSLGYKPTRVDQIVTLRIHGVTSEYIRSMAANGFRPTTEELVTMRIHGVSPEWIQEIRSAGYDRLSVDDLVSMRIHGVSSEFVREVAALGYENLRAEDLVSMRIHGVSASFIRQLKEAGYDRVPVEKLVEMKILGIDGDFVKALGPKRK